MDRVFISEIRCTVLTRSDLRPMLERIRTSARNSKHGVSHRPAQARRMTGLVSRGYHARNRLYHQPRDVDLGPVRVCEVCGYTLEGEAPERCQVCSAKKERFTAFSS